MSTTIKHIWLIFIVLILSIFTASYSGNIYNEVFNEPGTWVDLSVFSGFPIAYIFFLPLLFTAFGGLKKYWWIGILLIPAAAFEVYFDWAHIYFPIIIGLIGWGVGWGVAKFIASRKPQVI
jgi:hypothetical protein